jgi:hypothetical protein
MSTTIDPTGLAVLLRNRSGVIADPALYESLYGYKVGDRPIADAGPASAQFFRHIVEVFTERLAATDDPAAAWLGLADDPGFGPDHDDIEDFLIDVAIDSVGRIQFFEDITRTFAEVSGWEWETDTTFEGPGGIVDEMLMVLRTIAEVYADALADAARQIVREALAATE